MGLRIGTPRPSRPRFSLVVVINLDRTILALRISEVTRPDKCITPEIDPVPRDAGVKGSNPLTTTIFFNKINNLEI